jgi:Ca-activated chloride channel family protein
MIRQFLALTALLSLAASNAPAATNNPEPAAKPDTTAPATITADPAVTPGIEKLSKRERKERIAKLGQKHRDFLRDVEPIMIDTELNTFLILESDAQRDAYIEDFWKRRDPDPRTAYNDFRENYEAALVEVRQEFKNMISDRSRIFLIRGRPGNRVRTECRLLVPMEIWQYDELPGIGHNATILFYQPRIGGNDYRLFRPIGRGDEDLAELISADVMAQYQHNPKAAVDAVFRASAGGGMQTLGARSMSRIEFECKDGRLILDAVYGAQFNRIQIAQLFDPPKVNEEDVNRMLRTSVISTPSAAKFPAEFAAAYPGKRGARTAVELTFTVDAKDLRARDIEGAQFYNVDVNGEVLKDEKLYESFHYRYNFPVTPGGSKLPIVIERYLRPADYKARIKIMDVNTGAEAILENVLTVPHIEDDPDRKALKAEGNATIRMLQEDVEREDARLRIVPLSTDLLTGLQHIETILSGDKVKSVEFYLDGKKVMVKRSPPYSLDLDFGPVPQTRTIKAVGLNEKGEIITGDEVLVNSGMDPFRVRIVSPRVAPKVAGNVRVELDASVPDGKKLQKIELYLNETKLATLFDKPYVQTINIPPDLGIAYLRAVATVDDENAQAVEDVVFINTPEFMQEVEVHLVELPTTVQSNSGRHVLGLNQNAFKVFDEGKPVKIAKFDFVDNLKLSLGLAIDSSGSMRPKMLEAQRAGAAFFKNILRPGDRAFVTAFDSEPVMLQKWTPSLADVNAGLASLRAEEATALYDAIVYSLYNFHGIRGQRALIVISDGKDTASKFSFDQAIEYARRSGIPIYGIGIGIRAADVEAKYKFGRFSSETGGNTYYIDSAGDLSKVYEQIHQELRSQYILGFYPPAEVKSGDKWREVRVETAEGKAKTIRGYYP